MRHHRHNVDTEPATIRSSVRPSRVHAVLGRSLNELGSDFDARLAAVRNILSDSDRLRWFDPSLCRVRIEKKTTDWAQERESAFRSFELLESARLFSADDPRSIDEQIQAIQAISPWRRPGPVMSEVDALPEWEACAALVSPLLERDRRWERDSWGNLWHYRTVPVRLALEALKNEACTADEKDALLLFLRSPWKAQAQVVTRCLNAKPNPNAWIYHACLVAELGLDAANDMPLPVWSLNQRWPECWNRTSLHIAAGLSYHAPLLVGLLLAFGADANSLNRYGGTPLIDLRFSRSNYVEDTQVIRLLAAAGADLDVCPSYRPSALHSAAMSGALQAMLTLVELGARLDNPMRSGHTPLECLEEHCGPEARQQFEAVLAVHAMEQRLPAVAPSIAKSRL